MRRSRAYWSATVLSLAVVVSLLSFTSPQAKAAYTDNFDALLVELQDRALVLSNSSDKVEQKQFKAVGKALAAINKPADSLADDLKTAGKVAKALAKAFPDEFNGATNSTVVISAVFMNDISSLVINLFTDIASDIQDAFDQVQAAALALPDGPGKIKALAALAKAQLGLDLADSATDLKTLLKGLGGAIKGVASTQKAIDKAGGGGGSTNDMLSATIVIGGTNFNWSTDMGGAEWVQSSGILDIGGTALGYQVSAAQCSNFTGNTGDYPLGGSCGGVVDFGSFISYGAMSGTLHIETFDAMSQSLSGTFAYEASDGMTSITVSNGMFNLHNLTVTP